ncbi:MAG TPA: hypothetical protein VMT34_11410 [Aggregatilineales bacterium]|nr:hypothetical protein [Aggregatilineales bacterium]
MPEIDQVIELDLGCIPEAAVSGGVLVKTDRSTFLTFNAMRKIDRRCERAGYALIEFTRCLIAQFGYPNDEARVGHPLYSSGLQGYGIYEVVNSSWSKRLDQQNRVAFPNFTALVRLVDPFDKGKLRPRSQKLVSKVVQSTRQML